MKTKTALTTKQKEVVAMMRDGWALYCDRKHGTCLIRGVEKVSFRMITIEKIFMKNIIIKDINSEKYVLTKLGKTINL